VSTGVDLGYTPDFAPDGTHIAFYSGKNGGGIYIASTLGGEPRLVVGVAGDVAYPRFSPGGETILYDQDYKAFTVSVDGGGRSLFPSIRNSAYIARLLVLQRKRDFVLRGAHPGAK
jgi:hypothetical protein